MKGLGGGLYLVLHDEMSVDRPGGWLGWWLSGSMLCEPLCSSFAHVSIAAASCALLPTSCNSLNQLCMRWHPGIVPALAAG